MNFRDIINKYIDIMLWNVYKLNFQLYHVDIKTAKKYYKYPFKNYFFVNQYLALFEYKYMMFICPLYISYIIPYL